MLYLVKLDNAYKIGYTKNVESRIKNIFATHVDCKLVSTKFGNKKDEKELHSLCERYKIKNELFEVNEEVVNIFNIYISKHLLEDIKKVNEVNK